MLIGREKERKALLNAVSADESQFVAVYGRRRVGKTYLIKQTFSDDFAFQHTGLAKANKAEQLAEFQESLKRYGLKKCRKLSSWQDAFHKLADLLELKPVGKKLVFIDEMPWMDTAQSGFISALEHFWNGWANMRNDIVLIICGSATSWIVSKIIMDYGGLHNRLTLQIQLSPFNLSECEQFCRFKGLAFTRKDVAEAYMVLGGIPYYWNYFRKEDSLAQGIDYLFFSEAAPLKWEYTALFASLFKKATSHLAIVEALANKYGGLSRQEILDITKLSDNTAFSDVLGELEHCGFIRKFCAFGKKEKGATYQLIDSFSFFYNRFLKNNSFNDEHYWSQNLSSGEHAAWVGCAFERLCLLHLPQIKKSLGISGVVANAFSWQTKANEEHDGAQIDLLIDRSDNVINICEMKFANDEFVIDKEYDAQLRRKLSVFSLVTKSRKTVHLTMVTSYGVRHNSYYNTINSEVCLDDLFSI